MSYHVETTLCHDITTYDIYIYIVAALTAMLPDTHARNVHVM